MQTETLKSLCSRVRASATYGIRGPIPADFRDSQPWTVRLTYRKRQMTVPFFMGRALCREPSAEDVMECLLSDASGVESSRGFEDWCAEMGFDTDSRKAEATYRACERNAEKLRRLLGDDFSRFAEAER